jgi:hypothetical protein
MPAKPLKLRESVAKSDGTSGSLCNCRKCGEAGHGHFIQRPDATCHTLPEPFAALFHLSHLDIHLRHVPNPFANAHTMRRVAPASAGSRSDAQRFRVRISEARRHLGGHTFASRPPPFAPLRYRQSSVPLVDRNAAHLDEHPRLVHRNAPLVGDNDTLVPGNDPYVRRNDTRVPRNDTHVLGNLALVRG